MDREKVLIVEDELDLLDLLDFNLTRKGFITCASMDGQDAVEKVRTFDPGLVVLDLMLPNMDGLEVCRQMRREKGDILILMLTARSTPEDKVKGFEAGADDYMTKPFSVKELILRVDKLLSNRKRNDLNTFLIHEMSNRVHSIGCFSELLSRRQDFENGKSLDYLSSIKKEVANTTELIAEIGSLMEAESGCFRAQEPVDMEDVITEAASVYGATASHKSILLVIDIERGMPLLDLSRNAAMQMMANLIGNAFKYTADGGTVKVSAKNMNGSAVVTVADSGCGIPEKDLPHIFERGYRASNAAKEYKGSGIGLSIVKTIASRVGADIEVKSVVGQGSEFKLTFSPAAAVRSESKAV